MDAEGGVLGVLLVPRSWVTYATSMAHVVPAASVLVRKSTNVQVVLSPLACMYLLYAS